MDSRDAVGAGQAQTRDIGGSTEIAAKDMEEKRVERTIERSPGRAVAAGSGIVTALRWVAGATALLVLVQAVLIGQGSFAGNAPLILRHGELGNLTFVAAIALAVLAFLGRRRGLLGTGPLALSVVLLVLLVAQLGLGYVGRESAGAAAWHVPNGVLIFGLTTLLFSLVAGWQRDRTAD